MGLQKFALVSVVLFFMVLVMGARAQEAEFDFGKGETQFKWGMEVPLQDTQSDFRLRLGTRLQAIVEDVSKEAGGGAKGPSDQDFYVRRARLQVEAKMRKNLSYYMDIRADKVDKGNDDTNGFALGDAFFQVKNLLGSEALKLRLFRAKYDVSRSQTVSSSRLLILNRAPISDYSAEYISQARRGSNIQILGNWSRVLSGQVIVGDSVDQGSFQDSMGKKTVTDIKSQNLAYGARVRLSPIPGWEEAGMTETYFGQGKHFTLGVGYFATNNVSFEASGVNTEVDRSLLNAEMSLHYGSFSLAGEYFEFEGVVDDFSTAAFTQGKSDGWFAQAEYVFTGFHYLAPYVRYQVWDRFKDRKDFDENSLLVGLNYYIKGNKLRIGAYHDQAEYGDGLVSNGNFSKTITTIGLNLMMHY